ncbi:hypothetical protein [Streptomyces sp. NPDC056661]|uniref:hypothetical protein n=1 Tax=unclassified Streptomyces TaxID=2593676 RepID=UPI00369264B4
MGIQTVVDLTRCQDYVPCPFLAPETFELHGDEGEGFTGALTAVGDEPHLLYDRPPLSKRLLLVSDGGYHRADAPGPEHRLAGARAIGLDLLAKQVLLEDGESLPYDR